MIDQKTIDKDQNKKNKTRSFIISMLKALLLVLLIRSFFIQAFYIPSGSMKPNLLIGDYLFVNKFSYGYSKYSLPFNMPILPEEHILGSDPKRGDIVVFKFPGDKSKDFVKRVIGFPGDKIQMINSVVYINNVPLKRTYIADTVDNGVDLSIFEEEYAGLTYNIYQLKDSANDYLVSKNYGPVVVPQDHYFMMGDNRDFSKDSRFEEVGFIHKSLLVGKPVLIFFSINGYFLEFWKYFSDIRWDRIFKSL